MPAKAPADSPEVRARIEEGIPLAEALARRMRKSLGTVLSQDDAMALGREGAMNAARSYDPSRGIPFDAWVILRARGAILDGVRAMSPLPRQLYRQLRAHEAGNHVQYALEEEVPALQGPSFSATPTVADDLLGKYLSTLATAIAVGYLAPGRVADGPKEDASPEDALVRAELLGRVREAIAQLPETERSLLERHYFGEVTLDEAARELGFSRSWGSRLHARAIEGIARHLKRSGVDL